MFCLSFCGHETRVSLSRYRLWGCNRKPRSCNNEFVCQKMKPCCREKVTNNSLFLTALTYRILCSWLPNSIGRVLTLVVMSYPSPRKASLRRSRFRVPCFEEPTLISNIGKWMPEETLANRGLASLIVSERFVLFEKFQIPIKIETKPLSMVEMETSSCIYAYCSLRGLDLPSHPRFSKRAKFFQKVPEIIARDCFLFRRRAKKQPSSNERFLREWWMCVPAWMSVCVWREEIWNDLWVHILCMWNDLLILGQPFPPQRE